MSKARREIAQALSGVDVVIEVVDARLPVSSSNPILEKLRGGKPCVKVLNKQDLADPGLTKAWVRHFAARSGVAAVPVEAKNRKEAGAVLRQCRSLVPHKGRPGRTLRVMVVGIPNVGKSTLINTLAGKGIARVGDKPAITTCRQQVNLPNHIILDDTPGLLWPDLRDHYGALRLAASGAIGDSGFDSVEAACFAIAFLLQRYPGALIRTLPLRRRRDRPGPSPGGDRPPPRLPAQRWSRCDSRRRVLPEGPAGGKIRAGFLRGAGRRIPRSPGRGRPAGGAGRKLTLPENGNDGNRP